MTLFLFLQPFHFWPHRCSHCQNSLHFFFNSGSQNSIFPSSFFFNLISLATEHLHFCFALKIHSILILQCVYLLCSWFSSLFPLSTWYCLSLFDFCISHILTSFPRDHITSLISLDTCSPYSVSLSFLTDSLHEFSLLLICNHIPICNSDNHCEMAQSLENVHCNPTTKPYQSRHLLDYTVTSLYEFSCA